MLFAYEEAIGFMCGTEVLDKVMHSSEYSLLVMGVSTVNNLALTGVIGINRIAGIQYRLLQCKVMKK